MTKPKAKAKRKLDLFVVLESLDLGDMRIYDKLSTDPENLAEFCRDVGYMLPIWMTGATRDADHIELVKRFNVNCNEHWFDLTGKHQLQAKLLAGIGLGRKVSHRFSRVKPALRSNVLMDLLTLSHPDIRPAEVRIWAAQNTADDAEELARGYGWTDEQVTKLQKSYNEMRL